MKIYAFLFILLSSTLFAQTVTESERQIPLVYDVDVLVLGGTTRGVAAAKAAAENGASVFLAAPRAYLGEDMCSPYHFWLNDDETLTSDLAKDMFTPKLTERETEVKKGLDFTYEASKTPLESRPDSKENPRLTDGNAKLVHNAAVQYKGNVSIIADLGKSQELSTVTAFAFMKWRKFDVDAMKVYTSNDKKNWNLTDVTVFDRQRQQKVQIGTGEINEKARYVKLDFEKTGKAHSIVLAEIIINGKKQGDKNATKMAKTTTPMTIKHALDKALIQSNVDYLYGCYATELLVDKKGDVAGMVMANRSGRQAVRAKVIIDASDRAILARMSKAEFTPYPKGKNKFSRIVLGGEPGPKAKKLKHTYNVEGLQANVYQYDFEIDMKDNSWLSFAKADEVSRNQSYQIGQLSASETLFQIPPDPVKGKKSSSANWTKASDVDLDCLRPAGVEYLYILGGCADVSRESAAKIMRPITGMNLGERVGKSAASKAKQRQLDPHKDLVVYATNDKATVNADIGEMLNGIRSTKDLDPKGFITSTARALPVLAKYDTVVVGGGTGGAPAAIGAARGGARTLVIEKLHGLGGVGTLGRISKYYHGNKVGFTTEVDEGVKSLTHESTNDRKGWDLEAKMEWFRKEIVKAGGEIWFHSLGIGSVVKDKKFIGVVVITPHGRGIVLANTIIDSTGNSVIPACAGLPTQVITGEHISVQGTGLPSYTPGQSYKNSDWTFTDDDDVLDMWRIHVVARKKYRNFFDQGQLIDTRARRRIIGDITVSPMDIINNRIFSDIITVSKSNFDNHGFSSHDLFMIKPADKQGLTGNVPYRALLPKNYDGILVTGLGMSAHGDSLPVMRMQADVQNHGYAAGKASAMAAEEATTVRKIDVTELQKHLAEIGIIPENYINAKDSYPLSKEMIQTAVKSIKNDYNGIAVILTNPEAALPLLRKEWKDAKEIDDKVKYAHVLAMLFDGTGSKTLIQEIQNSEWDQGWVFRGMGQFGATTSPLDNLIIAVSRTGDKEALPVIIDKVKQITPETEFSHFRSVSMALENYKDPAAAKPLADLLSMPGIAGHHFVDINETFVKTPGSTVDDSSRNNSLKELIVARALFRCGDYRGIGEETLKRYSKDYRGHYASHAKEILAGR